MAFFSGWRDMNDDLQQMQQRLTVLEREVRQLRKKVTQCEHGDDVRPWWEKISGTFRDDPVFEEIIRLGRKIRKADKPRRGARR